MRFGPRYGTDVNSRPSKLQIVVPLIVAVVAGGSGYAAAALQATAAVQAADIRVAGAARAAELARKSCTMKARVAFKDRFDPVDKDELFMARGALEIVRGIHIQSDQGVEDWLVDLTSDLDLKLASREPASEPENTSRRSDSARRRPRKPVATKQIARAARPRLLPIEGVHLRLDIAIGGLHLAETRYAFRNEPMQIFLPDKGLLTCLVQEKSTHGHRITASLRAKYGAPIQTKKTDTNSVSLTYKGVHATCTKQDTQI